MRLILFSGNHPRHVFVHSALCAQHEIVGIVCMEREGLLPTASVSCDSRDQDLFRLHFQRRFEVEQAAYKDADSRFYDTIAPVLRISRLELNSEKTWDFVRRHDSDACFIFGTNLLKDELMRILPRWQINLHLGLSPWFKGSATLFWPFYLMQPQFAGATIHQIELQADAGEVIHQSAPFLRSGMGIHDVGAEVVRAARDDAARVLKLLAGGGKLPLEKQRTSGRVFLDRDFEPHHLRVNYELFGDRMVDAWLNGHLGNRVPKLVRAFEAVMD